MGEEKIQERPLGFIWSVDMRDFVYMVLMNDKFMFGSS